MLSNAGRSPSLSFDRVAATLAALVVVGLAIYLLSDNQPIADPKLFFVLRVVLSLSAAILGATIPGFLDIRWSGRGLALRAGGAIALFMLAFLYSPAALNSANTISAPNGVAIGRDVSGNIITINPTGIDPVDPWPKPPNRK